MAITVISAGLVSGLVVSSGQTVEVVDEGVLYGATVLSGGTVLTSAGGEIFGGTVSGALGVGSGGYSQDVLMASGGSETVRGSALGTTLAAGANFTVVSGGTASGTTAGVSGSIDQSRIVYILASGGTELLLKDASTSLDLQFTGHIVAGSLAQFEYDFNTSGLVVDDTSGVMASTIGIGPGTTASNVSVLSGNLIVSSGATVSGGTLHQFNDIVVLSGGAVDDIVFSDVEADKAIDLKGGSAARAFVTDHGSVLVSSGSTSYATHLAGSLSREFVSAGGAASASVVSAGGLQLVLAGGRAVATEIDDAGTQYVSQGGTATGTILNGGGNDFVYAGGIASATAVMSGGAEAVTSGGQAFDAEIMSGGLQIVSSGGLATRTILHEGGSIQRDDLAYAAGESYVFVPQDDLLIISGGGAQNGFDVSLSGDYTGETFHLSADADGGTQVTVDSVACYCAGARMLTEHGELPVERLAVGDIMVTAAGEKRPVIWLGRRSYTGRVLASRPDLWPIRLRAGCLGGGLPRRDLLVSPGHAMFLDGVLVAARHLVNGTTVARDRVCGQVDYFHVELATHDVLLAEGAPAESFVDDDSRGLFQNAAEWQCLYGRRLIAPVRFCAPRVESGPLLETIRRRTVGPGRGDRLAAQPLSQVSTAKCPRAG